MKRVRTMGLALVAVLVASFASTAVAANPVFYTKANVGGTAPSKIPFTATLGSAFLEPASKSKITCTGGTAVGETASTTTTVKNLTKLQTLMLSFTGVNDAGLDQLRGLKELRLVEVSGAPVSPGAMKRLEDAIPGVKINKVR